MRRIRIDIFPFSGGTRALRSLTPLLGLFLSLLMLGGCQSHMAEQEQQDQAGAEQPADSSSIAPPQTEKPAPVPTATETNVTKTVGERLGVLDAKMRTAPPDSVAVMRAEYQRILDSMTLAQRGPVQTGGSRPGIADSTRIDTAVARPADSSALTGGPGEARLSLDTFTTHTPPDTVVTDPSRLFKGLRKSELRVIPGYAPEVAENVPRTTPRTVRHRPDRFAGRRHYTFSDNGGAAPKVSGSVTPQGSTPATEHAARRGYVNGVAEMQAGRYKEAVRDLGPAMQSGAVSPSARYQYAYALEKTGQTSKAADQYFRASKGGGELGQKAYVAYCRLIAQMGQRDKARRLVLQFIEQHPDSTQVVTARRLLQTM